MIVTRLPDQIQQFWLQQHVGGNFLFLFIPDSLYIVILVMLYFQDASHRRICFLGVKTQHLNTTVRAAPENNTRIDDVYPKSLRLR